MSAFILSHEDYKFIGSCLLGYAISPIGSIHWWDTWNFLGSGFEVESPRYKADRETALKAVNKKLQALYLMNVEAIKQRYDEKNDRDELDLDLYPKTTNTREFINRLSSLRYNCAEGNVPNTQLYKDLDHYIGKVCEWEIMNY